MLFFAVQKWRLRAIIWAALFVSLCGGAGWWLAQRGEPASDLFTIGHVDIGNVLAQQRVECRVPYSTKFSGLKGQMSLTCSCGCIQAGQSLDAGTSGEQALTLVLTTPNAMGPFRKHCAARVGDSKPAVIEIVGNVIPEVEWTPDVLWFGGQSRSGDVQSVRITRFGLSREQFQHVQVRTTAGALELAELVRNDDHIDVSIRVTRASPVEIERGILLDLVDSKQGARVLGAIRCKWGGPYLRPAVAVFAIGSKDVDRSELFEIISPRSDLTVVDAEFADDRIPKGVKLSLEHTDNGRPAVQLIVAANATIPAGTYEIRIRYGPSRNVVDGSLSFVVQFF